MLQGTPFTIPLIVTAAILIAPALYVWRRHRVAAARTISIILLAGTGWILTYVLELSSMTLPAKIFWSKLQYIAVIVVCSAWLIFTLQYSGREKWVTRKTLALLVVFPVVTVVLVSTNEIHGLIWSSVTLVTEGPFISSEYAHGPWFWVHTAYLHALVLMGVFFLVQMLMRSHRLYRWQIIPLLLAVSLPMLKNALYLLGLDPLSYLGLVVVTFPVVSLIVAWSLFRFRPADIVPVARGAVIDGMSDAVIVLDPQNRIVDLNPAAQRLTGYSVSEALRQSIEKVWPHWLSQIAFGDGITDIGKEVSVNREDGEHTYDVRVSPLTDWQGDIISRVVVLRDVSQRKEAEEKIKQSLKEKEILLREIHHRVKNNLQVISSLLNLQSSYVSDNRFQEMLKESQDRVKSMALIHEKLYQSEDLADIDFREYVETLTQGLIRSHGVAAERISLRLEVEDVSLGVDTAIYCGLIINELVSNCLKHGFPCGREGEVLVGLRSADGSIELVVADDGVGVPEDIDFRTTETLGLRLVTILAERQLDGTIELSRGGGTTFRITFKE